MSITRISNDINIIQKKIEDSNYNLNYILNKPGYGNNPIYVEEPNIRLEKWGGNQMKNMVNIENNLYGLNKKLNRSAYDENNTNNNNNNINNDDIIQYPTSKFYIDDTRLSNPAWMYRDIESIYWENPVINPYIYLEKRFNDNISTRILEKDYYNIKNNL